MTRIPELYGWLSNGTALYDETHGHTASTLEHLVIIIFHLWLVLSAVLLMNLLIAMMNNTYNIVLAEAEQKWRLQFLDLVLFQEATPWIFSPFPCFSRANRPKHHVKGKVAVATAEGEVQVAGQISSRPGRRSHTLTPHNRCRYARSRAGSSPSRRPWTRKTTHVRRERRRTASQLASRGSRPRSRRWSHS